MNRTIAQVNHTMAAEIKITKSAVNELLEHGFLLSVHNGEEVTVSRSADREAILKAMRTTDEERLIAYKAATGPSAGWVFFVYGNDGWDVINDYTTGLEDFLAQTNTLADKLEEEG